MDTPVSKICVLPPGLCICTGQVASNRHSTSSTLVALCPHATQRNDQVELWPVHDMLIVD